MKLEFYGHIFETQISNFVKIRAVGVELFQAGGRTARPTDMTKLLAFRNFANARKNHGAYCI